MKETDKFTRAYIQAALWSSTDDNGTPLDAKYDASDIEHETLERMYADCERFQDENAGLLTGLEDEQAGHDFWLTRNFHGSGYWDGDYEPEIGNALTDASHAYGSFDLYIGDDKLIHGS